MLIKYHSRIKWKNNYYNNDKNKDKIISLRKSESNQIIKFQIYLYKQEYIKKYLLTIL